MSSHSTSTRRGFALPDLLMTLAGLLLLLAIALPLVLKQRAASHKATCISNLKQVNRAVLQYAEANNDTLPAHYDKPGGVWWWYKELVKSHVGLTGASTPNDKVFACPDDRGYDEETPFWKSAKFDYGSYNFNGVTIPGSPHIAGRTLASIKDPQKTLLTMEWTAHGPLSWHRSRTGRKNLPFYNDAESVVGFVDGHVDFIKIHYDGMNPAYTRDPIPGYNYKYSGD